MTRNDNLLAFLILLVILMSIPTWSLASSIPGFQRAYVEGNVVDGSGKPISGAKIDVIGIKVSKQGMKASNACGDAFAMTSINGNFSVGVGRNNMCTSKKHPINGKYSVRVSKRSYLSQTQSLPIDFAAHVTNVIGGLRFTMLNAESSIQGQVFVSGKPLPYAQVFVMKNPYAMMLHNGKMSAPKGHVPFTFSEIPTTRADGNGKFTIPVSPGDYVVMARKSGYAMLTKTVNPMEQQLFAQMFGNPYMARAVQSNPKLKAQLAEANAPQSGVFLHIVPDQIGAAMIAMVRDLTGSPHPPGGTAKATFQPTEMKLAGQALLPQNNVLFFSSLQPQAAHTQASFQRGYALSIVRSSHLLGSGKIDLFKTHLKEFNFFLYGYPGAVGCRGKSSSACATVWSFTDPTAISEHTYYYYVFEAPPYFIGTNGRTNAMQTGSPYSNAVQVVTH